VSGTQRSTGNASGCGPLSQDFQCTACKNCDNGRTKIIRKSHFWLRKKKTGGKGGGCAGPTLLEMSLGLGLKLLREKGGSLVIPLTEVLSLAVFPSRILYTGNLNMVLRSVLHAGYRSSRHGAISRLASCYGMGARSFASAEKVRSKIMGLLATHLDFGLLYCHSCIIWWPFFH
jgi:hypothetical protein